MGQDTTVVANTPEIGDFKSIPLYMRNARVIGFNGPPGSGKSEAVRMALEILAAANEDLNIEARRGSFADPVKDAVHNFLDLDVPTNHYEAVKDVPSPDFHGATPRQAYINISEGFVKPTFGKNFWAENLLTTYKRSLRQAWVAKSQLRQILLISDLGFQIEADLLRRDLPQPHWSIVKMQRDGCSFDGDSRQWVFGNSVPPIWEKQLWNNGSLEDLRLSVCNFLVSFFSTDEDPVFQEMAKRLRA